MENVDIRQTAQPRAPRRNVTPPMLIEPGGRAVGLERQPLARGGGGEAWLQALIHDSPEVLPIAAIEPAFGRAVSAVRELPCGHGYIDNLLITPQGQIVLVEAKLWVNPQARREVIAQALDYVSALMAMGYEQFEATIGAARGDKAKLYDLIADQPDALDEMGFIDAMARNLASGRMLVLVVGDGITAESERLAAIVQGRVDAHFTLALVELAVYAVGDQRLVVPSTIARTTMLERAVIRIDHADRPALSVRAPARIETTGTTAKRAQTISDQEFDAMMEARRPGLSGDIRAFVSSLEPLGIYVDQQRSLILKVEQGGEKSPINLGYIQRNGQLHTNAVEWFAPPHIARAYLDRLAAAWGGSVIHTQHHFVSLDGKSAPRVEQILPYYADAWRDAIAQLVREVADAATHGTADTIA